MQINIKELMEKNRYHTINIIDIRDYLSYQRGHIVNAINIPAKTLLSAPEKYLKPKEIYYIYCQTGRTSKQLVNILNKRGYHTFNVIGGYNNYVQWK